MILIWWYVSDFFNFLFDIFEMIFDFIGGFIEVMIQCVSFLGRLFLVTPNLFKISLVALVAISVVYKLLGRESQS